MIPRKPLLLTVLVLLSGCIPAGSAPTVMPVATTMPNLPSATLTQAMATVSQSPALEIATTTVESVAATPEPEQEPTIAESPPPPVTLIPQETAESTAIPQPSAGASAIQLYSPGPQSKIVSPLNIYGYAVPGFNHKGRVDLYGEDGRIITSEILQLNTAYKWAYFYWPLNFAISSTSELGRLSMSTQDQYGRLTALYSVHLLLLPEGDSIINPPGYDLIERCLISEPAVGQRISGGSLTISGTMLPFNDLPLSVQLTDRNGNVLTSQLVPLPPSDGKSVPFRVDIQYAIPRSTWELLSVSQFDDRIGGLMYLYSQEVLVNP